MSLQGDLGELSMGELLQTITLNNHEGTLKILSEEKGDRYFYLSKGEIQLVSPGKKGLRLGEALIKARKITQADLDKALVEQHNRGLTLGKTLIDIGLIQESDLEAAIQQQFRDEFFDIFLLTKGAFEFFFRTRPDQLVQFDDTVSRVSMNTSGLMLEALRQIDEWQVMSKTMPTPRAVFKVASQQLVDESLEKINPAEDVKQAVALIDGRHTIADVVEQTPATKFDVYTLLHQLYERKAIRPLTAEECSDMALGAETGGDTFAATIYYEFGVFLAPENMDLREREFKLLKRLNVYKEAKEAALVIADHKLEAKDLDGALEYYLEAQACDDKDPRAAEGVFRTSVQLGKDKARTGKAGDEVVKLAIRNRDVKKATEVLAALVELEPTVYRRRIQLAELIQEDEAHGGKARAMQLLEEAILGLAKPEEAKLKAEASRKLLALDSRRTDAQVALKEAVATEEKQARMRLLRIVGANVGGVLLLVGAWLGTNELAARRAFAEADQIAAKATNKDELALASQLFRDIGVRHPWSTVAGDATARVDDLKGKVAAAAIEEQKRMEAASAQRTATAEESRRRAALDLLRRAEAAELRGDWKEAAQEKLDLARDYADVKLDQKVRLAVPIATEPAGARVLLGADEVGTTPAVIHVEPLKETRVRVELAGFVPRDLVLRADRFEEVKLALERTSLWTYKTGGAIEAPPAISGSRVFVASRDGYVYALDVRSGALGWRLKIGEYGDHVSPPSFVSGKCVVASSDGVVQALDPGTGAIVWTFRAPGAVRGDVRASANGLLLGVGASSGEVHFLNAANGQPVFKVAAEKRVDGGVAFGPTRAFFGARDARLYAVDLAKAAVAWKFDAGDDFVSAPLVLEDLVVAGARDGAVHAVSTEDGKERWTLKTAGRIRATPARSGGSVLVASEDGKLYAIDARTGSEAWRFAADGPIVAAPVVSERWVYLASTFGTLFRVDPSNGTSDWKFSLGGSTHAAPAVADGRIFVGAADGSVRAILE